MKGCSRSTTKRWSVRRSGFSSQRSRSVRKVWRRRGWLIRALAGDDDDGVPAPRSYWKALTSALMRKWMASSSSISQEV